MNGWAEAIDMSFEVLFPEDDEGRPEGALPATIEARDAASAGLRRFAGELSTEIATRWRE